MGEKQNKYGAVLLRGGESRTNMEPSYSWGKADSGALSGGNIVIFERLSMFESIAHITQHVCTLLRRNQR